MLKDIFLFLGGLDLIIVPAVGFTASGRRLGHGKGYYDTFLEQCMNVQKNPPITIGLAFKEQIQSDIPVTEHDKLIDHVLFAE